MRAVRPAFSMARSNPKRAACCSRSTTTMKVESNKPLGLRPYDRARGVFPTGRDAPNDYLERCLASIAELEPQVGAFVHLNETSAREAAAASAARWRDLNPKSLIDGMPVGIKDIVET